MLLVRSGAAAPLEVYMIRRQKNMRFLGGYYAFPGGKVDAADATAEAFARCRGLGKGGLSAPGFGVVLGGFRAPGGNPTALAQGHSQRSQEEETRWLS
jgi:hypothetical protein